MEKLALLIGVLATAAVILAPVVVVVFGGLYGQGRGVGERITKNQVPQNLQRLPRDLHWVEDDLGVEDDLVLASIVGFGTDRPGPPRALGTQGLIDVKSPRPPLPSAFKRQLRLSANKLALDARAGQLVENIPREMPLGKRQIVEVRIGTKDAANIGENLRGGGAVTLHDVVVVESMALTFYSEHDAFAIERLSEREQLVIKTSIAQTLLSNPAATDFASWKWAVKPTRRGEHELLLRVAARVRDSAGALTSHTIVPDQSFKIQVKVGWFAACSLLTKWLLAFGTIAAGAIATALIKDPALLDALDGLLVWLVGD